MRKVLQRICGSLNKPIVLIPVGIICLAVIWVLNRKPIGELKMEWSVAAIFLALMFYVPISDRIRHLKRLGKDGMEFHGQTERAESVLEEVRDFAPERMEHGTAQLKAGVSHVPADPLVDLAKNAEMAIIDLGDLKKNRWKSGSEESLVWQQQRMEEAIGITIGVLGSAAGSSLLDFGTAEILESVTGVSGWIDLAEISAKLYLDFAYLVALPSHQRESAIGRKLIRLWEATELDFEDKLRDTLRLAAEVAVP